jgi:hypothetical protein
MLVGCGGGGDPAAPSAPTETPSAPVAGNTVLAAAVPAAPLRVVIGQRQVVSIIFTPSDDQPATDLRVTGNLTGLPPGWSSASTAFACANAGRDGGCKLDLAYAPAATSAASTLTLDYAYSNSAGEAMTGSVAISYEAVPATRAYMANYDDHDVEQCAIEADGSFSNCSTAAGGLFFRPVAVAFNGSTAYVLNYGNKNIIQCDVGSSGIFANCRDSGAYGLDNPFGLAVHGTRVYVANVGNGTLTWCAIGAEGGLGSDCRGSGDPMFRLPFNVAFHGSSMYITDTQGNGGGGALLVCDLEDDGMFANCRDSGATLLARPEGLAIAGNNVYVTNYGSRTVTRGTIGGDALVSGCSTALTTTWSSSAIAVSGPHAYISQGSDHAVLHCDVAADGSLGNCGNAGASSLNYPMGLALR